ncbi:MAG: FAD-dependent oxidoreductase [bacterium]|nr:FAD-dependent oxidoreductase [bacterium]
MNSYQYLIIGGGITGVTAAETIRKADTRATIGIIGEEPYLLYSRVLLPHYLKNKIKREQLFLRAQRDFYEKNIDLRLDQKVAGIDTEKQTVTLENGTRLGYEKLLISSGGKVKPWGENGVQSLVYRLQTIEDTDRLKIDLSKIKKPIVIGGSFIGLEFLEVFTLNNISPTLLLDRPFFFCKLVEKNGGEILHRNFERHGIKILTGDAVESMSMLATGEIGAVTRLGHNLEADAVAVGIGLDKNLEFLAGTKIESSKAGIRVNEFLETNQKNIWAAGDVAEFYDVILERPRSVGNWTNSFLQGQKAGLNMMGSKEAFRAVSAYSITNLGFQITALGDCGEKEGIDSVVRYDMYQHLYERFFLRQGVLVGAVLINCFKDKILLTKLIESKTKLDLYKDRLTSFDFDLKDISMVE